MLNAVRRGPASVILSIPFLLNTVHPGATSFPRTRSCSPQIAAYVPTRNLQISRQWRQAAAAASATSEDVAVEAEVEQEDKAKRPPSDFQINEDIRSGPVTAFKDLSKRKMVCQTVVDTLTKDMGLETMTQVQSMTINETLKGIDVLAQARTGTGKTLAFLIPVLQNIITVDPQLELRSGSGRSGSSTDIRALIISPTRELAEQIAVEAKKVTRNTGVIVQTAVGGSQKSLGLRRIREQGCHILVGTPGRLNDILSDPYSKVRAPNLSAFVLDEADRLLDQGFAPDIATIQDALPDRKEVDRQTLLFSATVPREVMSIVRKTMKPDFKFVRTVQEGEQQTHEKVVQKLVNVRGMENFTPALVELCQREISQTSNSRPFKAIVYFGATADVSLTSSALLNLKDPEASVFHNHLLSPAKVIEIHAKLDQHQRTRAAETFRNATSAIMLSSDVTARGMDFPGVTHVIQIGLPPSEEQYVHRIGRTARGQNTGEGWLLVSGPELREAHSKLRSMPLIRDETLETAKVDMTKDAQLSQQTAKILTQVGEALRNVPRGLKAQSYMAGIGLNAWQPSKQGLIDALNNRAKYGWGMTEPPKVGQGLVQKLSLSRCVGLNIGYEEGARSEDRGRVGRAASPRGRFGSSTGGGFERGGREGGHNRLSQSGDGQGFRGRFTNPRASERDGDRFQRRDKEGRYGGRGSYRGRESRSLER